ncbi:MAG TPA: type II toxin-antitoxin system ParD family antitoxin [Caulobacteraceae bacterium]|jgi:antitoxin ParD1/3/4
MPARNVSLTPYLAEFVDKNVETGEFQNASEVVREGLRLLAERQRAETAKLEALRRAVQVGLDAADRGDLYEVAEGDEFAFIERLSSEGAAD